MNPRTKNPILATTNSRSQNIMEAELLGILGRRLVRRLPPAADAIWIEVDGALLRGLNRVGECGGVKVLRSAMADCYSALTDMVGTSPVLARDSAMLWKIPPGRESRRATNHIRRHIHRAYEAGAPGLPGPQPALPGMSSNQAAAKKTATRSPAKKTAKASSRKTATRSPAKKKARRPSTDALKLDTGSQFTKALENAWRLIQGWWSTVPNVRITVATGRKSHRLHVYGSFSPNRWKVGNTRIHEVLIGGEGLERGGRDTFATLLHEAVHAHCFAVGIEDSGRGNYHTKAFKNQALVFGLDAESSRRLGWHETTMPDETAERWEGAIQRIDDAIAAGGHRAPPARPKKDRNLLRLECKCGRVIRASSGCFDGGPIKCGMCKKTFEPKRTATRPRGKR